MVAVEAAASTVYVSVATVANVASVADPNACNVGVL